MNKPVYLGMSILDISKTVMYEFKYDYSKPKYGDRAKVCYMDTDSFFIHIETEDFYKDIADDVQKWFDTSNYDENNERPLPIGKNKKVLCLVKDELGGKILKVFVERGVKTQANLMDDSSEKKKAKGTKKYVIKPELMVESDTDCLFNDKIILKLQQRFKSDYHVLSTEEVNKMALSANDDKITNI